VNKGCGTAEDAEDAEGAPRGALSKRKLAIRGLGAIETRGRDPRPENETDVRLG